MKTCFGCKYPYHKQTEEIRLAVKFRTNCWAVHLIHSFCKGFTFVRKCGSLVESGQKNISLLHINL